MSAHLLTRQSHRPRPELPLIGDLALQQSRVHEFCGPARRTLAMLTIKAVDGPVFWIRPAWNGDRLNADGVVTFINPGRITFVSPRRKEDLLWCTEEILRAGCVPLVIAEVPDPPGLTPIRRLNLAAETGAEQGRAAPLGLLLIPGDGGAQGVETRWHITPRHSENESRWLLQRRRARMAPPAVWELMRKGRKVRINSTL